TLLRTILYNKIIFSRPENFFRKPEVTILLLDERINNNFSKLNENDLQIAHFINTHIPECKSMKIHELATFTHASNASINRFTRKLGFDGYSDFYSYLKLVTEHVHQLSSFKMDSYKPEL